MAKIYKSIFSVIMSIVCALFNIVPMFSGGQPSEIPDGAERYSYGEKAREVMDIYMPETDENVTVSNIKNLIKSVIQNALNSVWGSKAKLIT